MFLCRILLFFRYNPTEVCFQFLKLAYIEPQKTVTFSVPFFLTAGVVLPLFIKCTEVLFLFFF